MSLYFLLLDNLMPQNYKNITRNTIKRTKKALKQTNSYFLTAAGTIGCLVKIAMQQYGCGTLLSACRTAIDCHIISIHIRILLGCSLDPEFTKVLARSSTTVRSLPVSAFIAIIRARDADNKVLFFISYDIFYFSTISHHPY